MAAIVIFFFDHHIAFRKTDITKKAKIILSLSLALFTAPYIFFVSVEMINKAFG